MRLLLRLTTPQQPASSLRRVDEASLGVLPRGASHVFKYTVLFKEISDNIDIHHAGKQSSSRDGRFTEIIRRNNESNKNREN